MRNSILKLPFIKCAREENQGNQESVYFGKISAGTQVAVRASLWDSESGRNSNFENNILWRTLNELLCLVNYET